MINRRCSVLFVYFLTGDVVAEDVVPVVAVLAGAGVKVDVLPLVVVPLVVPLVVVPLVVLLVVPLVVVPLVVPVWAFGVVLVSLFGEVVVVFGLLVGAVEV